MIEQLSHAVAWTACPNHWIVQVLNSAPRPL